MAKQTTAGEFDYSQVELEDLREEYVPVIGFLVTPGKEDKNPKPTRFAGIIRDAIKQKKLRPNGQPQYWFSCESIENQECTAYNEEQDAEVPIRKGDRVGISESAGTRNMVDKVGHLVVLEYTGKLIPTSNGDMLEIKGKVSKEPVVTVSRK